MKRKKTLIQLIRTGSLEEIKEALKTASHDDVNEFGHTPLMVAIHCGNRKDFDQVFDLILEWDTNLDKKDKDGYTAFSHAVSLRKIKCVEKLLEKDIDVNIPCVVTVAPHPRAYEAFETAVARGEAAIYPKSTLQKMTALSIFIYKSYDYLAEKLVDKNANLDLIGGLDITPLSMAARANNLEMMQYLLEKKANPNIVPKNWRHYASCEEEVCPIALKKALKYGNGAALAMLISAGSRIPQSFPRKNNMYSTPLTYLFSQPNRQVAEPFYCLKILKDYVDISLCDSQNRSALSYAVENNFSGFVLNHLMDEKINNLPDRSGYTPMMYAWQNNNYQAMDMLYEKGIPMANNIFEPTGETLLMISLQEKNIEMVEFLLRYNPNLLYKDKKGNTVLNYLTGYQALDEKVKDLYQAQLAKVGYKCRQQRTN